MISFLIWYIFITIIGLLAFPLTYRLLPGLSDRGYPLSRILGTLLWGYLYWIFGSLGFLKNDVGGMIIALILLILMSTWALRCTGWDEIWSWLSRQSRLVIMIEIMFGLVFAGLAFIRSANPEIVGTEKPMELAFISAIMRSPSLPPNDPWLSGYAISYYYFGYVILAMFARMAGTSAGVAFNLGISLIFALSVLGSYSVLFNLLNHRHQEAGTQGEILHSLRCRIQALLGPFFVLIVSNFGGLLHILRLLGVFWQVDESGQQVSKFWAWLDIGRYAQPPPAETFPHWWWWQASRIVQDFDFNCVNKGDIIDEFPFFSFLLADLHPHVLAMPFAFLAISLALNLFLGGARGHLRWVWLEFRIAPVSFLLASVVLGSLSFFNTWDFPFYVTLFAGAYLLRELFLEEDGPRIGRTLWAILGELVKLGFVLGVSGALLYLPFYLGFQSQAGGPLPNLIYVTRGVYLWIHFIPFLVPIIGLLLFIRYKDRDTSRLVNGVKLTIGLVFVLLAVTLLLTFLISLLHLFEKLNPQAVEAAKMFLGSMAAPGWRAVILEGFKRRLTAPGTWLTLAVIISMAFAYLWPRQDKSSINGPSTHIAENSPSHIFVVHIILIGALLVLVPEFVFLRDLFGYRINTIFKFYFQVWLLWGIAAAYATIYLWRNLRGIGKGFIRVLIVLILGVSLTYPVMGIWSKTNGFQPYEGFTLDGTAYFERSNPDDAGAMKWLREAPLGVVAEAVGGSYSLFARMSAHSGQPTVLGWDFHEVQWRGGTDEMGSRRADIEKLYCTNYWNEAEYILRQYQIRYVVVGTMERNLYGTGSAICPPGLNETKFSRNIRQVYHHGNTSIYQVPDEILFP
jgi:YYY domain-containing protein